MIGLREDQQMKARMVNFLNDVAGHCGRGLAPSGGGSVIDVSTDSPLSGASRIVAPPLPHWTPVTFRPGVGSAASKDAR